MRILKRAEWEVWNILRERDVTAANMYMKKVVKRHKLAAPPKRKYDFVVVGSGTDWYVEKCIIGRKLSREEQEVVREYVWIPATNSIYDCTGRPFTSYVDFYLVCGKTVIYHSVCFDV